MKRYSVIHPQTGAQVAGPFNTLDEARSVQVGFGDPFVAVMWAGFSGVPSVACIFRNDGQLETVCHSVRMAHSICEMKNAAPDAHDYTVEMVLFNMGQLH